MELASDVVKKLKFNLSTHIGPTPEPVCCPPTLSTVIYCVPNPATHLNLFVVPSLSTVIYCVPNTD